LIEDYGLDWHTATIPFPLLPSLLCGLKLADTTSLKCGPGTILDYLRLAGFKCAKEGRRGGGRGIKKPGVLG
jgi:hypothetical protein